MQRFKNILALYDHSHVHFGIKLVHEYFSDLTLQQLLREQVSIRDLLTVVEALAD